MSLKPHQNIHSHFEALHLVLQYHPLKCPHVHQQISMLYQNLYILSRHLMARHGEVDAKSTAKRLLCLGDGKSSGFGEPFREQKKYLNKKNEKNSVKRMWKVHIVNTCWTYFFSKMWCPQAPSISCLELGSFALEQNARMFFVRFLLILMLLVLNQRSCAYMFILYINCVAKNEVTRFLATPKPKEPQGRHLSDWMEAIAKWAWFNEKTLKKLTIILTNARSIINVWTGETAQDCNDSLVCGKGTFCFWKVPNLPRIFKPSSSTL